MTISTELMFLHGRNQRHVAPEVLRTNWIAALKSGMQAAGLELPILETAIKLPYYANMLLPIDDAGEMDQPSVLFRGDVAPPADEVAFIAESLLEIQDELRNRLNSNDPTALPPVIHRDIRNWPAVLALLRQVDTLTPNLGSALVALATRDVYHYLTNLRVSEPIERAIRAEISSNAQTIVVAHSLGSVVAYRMLDRDLGFAAASIPKLVTLGSPLGISTIRSRLGATDRPAGVGDWYNARDAHDVVALFPLDQQHFPTSPPIRNMSNVKNPDPSKHAIEGYLGDPVVAREIHDALVGSV